jgi:hypothetical protein
MDFGLTEHDFNKLNQRADQALVIMTLSSTAALIVSVSLLLH